jgi:Fic family protein
MVGVRGENRLPGQFRRTQVHIGPKDARIQDATFVPPSPEMLPAALDAFEKYLHDDQLPALIHAALCHAQFETIHPFLDGNGRMGRLLITLLLCERKVLSKPLLYLSHYLKRHRAQYYDRLQAIRVDGNWEAWLAFFLRGVREVATEASDTARKILALREHYRERLTKERASPNLVRSFDFLFTQPVVNARFLSARVGMSFVTANSVLGRLAEFGIVREATGFKRNRLFHFQPYLDLFDDRSTAVDELISEQRDATRPTSR